MTAPGWYPDPSGRHERRYWDGSEWTEHGRDSYQYRPGGLGPRPPLPDGPHGAVAVMERPAKGRVAPFVRRDFTDENPVIRADGRPAEKAPRHRSRRRRRRPFATWFTRLVALTISLTGGLVPAGIASALGYGPLTAAAIATGIAVLGAMGGLWWLATSRRRAVTATRSLVVDGPANPFQRWLLWTIDELASEAGIPAPRLAINDVDAIDLVATGPGRRRSLLVITVGALQRLNQHEIRSLLAHGVSSIAGGEAVTIGLVQGVVNALVVTPARIVTSVVAIPIWPWRRSIEPMVADLARLAIGLPAAVLLCGLGRGRDRRVDEDVVAVAGIDSIEAALTRIRDDETEPDLPPSLHGLGIRAASPAGPVLRIISPHTDVSLRIAALD